MCTALGCRYEKCGPQHSWSTSHVFTDSVSFRRVGLGELLRWAQRLTCEVSVHRQRVLQASVSGGAYRCETVWWAGGIGGSLQCSFAKLQCRNAALRGCVIADRQFRSGKGKGCGNEIARGCRQAATCAAMPLIMFPSKPLLQAGAPRGPTHARHPALASFPLSTSILLLSPPAAQLPIPCRLERHADHHMHGSRPFHLLRNLPDAPQLPISCEWLQGEGVSCCT